ncbi:MAG: TIGR00269 family protein [Candidatus Nezhaarchaeales archaeon]
MRPCVKCKGEAVYFCSHSGQAFCRKCFINSVERRVKNTITRYNLLNPDDHVVVAVSGGKDSLVLLHILSRIERRFPKVKMKAITIDEGVKGYRERGIHLARMYAAKYGVPHYIASFKEVYGYTLDELVRKSESIGSGLNACTWCGILRRRLLNLKARELGATKVAVGHHLDDEAQTILMNMLRGSFVKLANLGPKPVKDAEGFIPRIKPLRYIPESEVALYAYFKGFDFYEVECRYVRTSLRDEVRNILNMLERKHVGTKFAIVRSADAIAPLLLHEYLKRIKFNQCRKCGEPTTREICRACEILEKLGIGA